MKTTLITGASGGIGAAFARKLAARKHNLCLVARSSEKLAALCDELKTNHGIKADSVALDLTVVAADAILFAETEKRGLEINWLINNAGIGSFGDFATNDLPKEMAMIDLNVRVLVALAHRYLQKMREQKSGVMINVSSTAGFQPVPFMATYAASKAFVTAFSEALWEENRSYGIKVLALCPGGTETNFFNAAGVGGDKLPMRSLQTPEDVVETALRGIANGDSQIISGWSNFLLTNVGNLVPNWLISRTIGGFLRRRTQKTDVSG